LIIEEPNVGATIVLTSVHILVTFVITRTEVTFSTNRSVQ